MHKSLKLLLTSSTCMCFQCGFVIFRGSFFNYSGQSQSKQNVLYSWIFPKISIFFSIYREEAGKVISLAEFLESSNFNWLCYSHSILQAAILDCLVCLGNFFRMMGAPFHLGTLESSYQISKCPLLSNNWQAFWSWHMHDGSQKSNMASWKTHHLKRYWALVLPLETIWVIFHIFPHEKLQEFLFEKNTYPGWNLWSPHATNRPRLQLLPTKVIPHMSSGNSAGHEGVFF